MKMSGNNSCRYTAELQFVNGAWGHPFSTDKLSLAKRYIQQSVELRHYIAGRIMSPEFSEPLVFNTVISLVRASLPMNSTRSIEWSAKEIYSSFDDKDRALAKRWLGSQVSDSGLAMMLSARGAEKAAQSFYRSLGYEVQDISIEQPHGYRWKLYDILLNGEMAVDVKNARPPYHQKYRYKEHCVPKFKVAERRDQDVTIAGVFSPYVKLSCFDNLEDISPNCGSVIFLGETSKSKIIELQQRFEQERLKIVTGYPFFIPPWILDYPRDFYAKHIECISELKRLDPEQLSGTLRAFNYNPVPIFLMAGLPIQASWRLTPWQTELYVKLSQHSDGMISLPVVFLTILTHFLDMISNSKVSKDYAPNGYNRLLLYEQSRPRFPLNICDPLNIIHDFCSTLNTLWKHSYVSNLYQFTHFRFYGDGLLQGTRKGDSRLETIIAYCGGKLNSGASCGFSPLILGEHETCSKCHRLICPKCGHCSGDENGNKCPGYWKRKETILKGR